VTRRIGEVAFNTGIDNYNSIDLLYLRRVECKDCYRYGPLDRFFRLRNEMSEWRGREVMELIA